MLERAFARFDEVFALLNDLDLHSWSASAAPVQQMGRSRSFDGDGNDMLVDQQRRVLALRSDARQAVIDPNPVQVRERASLVPCFTTGTTIATARGAVMVEDLVRGDMVMTRDNGLQEVRWVGEKPIASELLQAKRDLAPILIRAGALGEGFPQSDIMVSPNHRVLLTSKLIARRFNETELLVAAKHLVGMDGVERVMVQELTYHHFMFDRHEIVLSNGAWTESFQPADSSLSVIDAEQRAELFAIFPTLEHEVELQGFEAARRSVRVSEVELLAGF